MTRPNENRPAHTLERLAEERTMLANERNMLAYIRTGLSVFLVGMGLIKLFDASPVLRFGGWASAVAGAALILLGLALYPLRKRKISSKR